MPRRAPAILFVSCGLASLFLGCTLPRPGYKQVDHASPAFQAAVAAETQRLLATDLSMTAAVKQATARVTEQFIAAEKERRTREVTPLAEILAGLDRPRGCWAYTVTTTRLVAGAVPVVTIETFDPFQPEARLWTLISRNGQPPDENAQMSYRAAKLRKWKEARSREARPTGSERVSRRALSHDFEVEAPADSAVVTYTFTREDRKVPLLGNTGSFRETLVANHATGTLLQRTQTLLTPLSLSAGGVKVDHFQSTTDYLIVDPTLPPFVAKTSARFQMRVFGNDTGAVEQEAVYSDYRRVKCYDDRFEVKIGAADFLDYLPSQP